MIDVAALREHLETDLGDAALARVRAAAIADQVRFFGPLDPLDTDGLARRNGLLIDMVTLAVTYNGVHVRAIGQVGADAGAYTKSWAHLLQKIRPVVCS